LNRYRETADRPAASLANRKGETLSTNPGDVSTATNAVSKERNEPREFREPGGIVDPAGSRP